MVVVLNEHDYHQYVETHIKVLYYTGKVQKMLPAEMTLEAFYNLPFKRKYQCREELYKNMYLIDSYINEHTAQLPAEEVRILEGFKKKIQSDFIILKCLTKHCIFIDCKSNLVYMVKALSDPFPDFFRRIPAYFSTTLLPFKNMIIYDGFINMNEQVTLGPGITADMNEIYKEAKKNHTLVATL